MVTSYLFKIGNMTCILNDESSAIGYTYPRIFVGFPDDSYLNLDLSIGAIFAMSDEGFHSWLDGSEIRLNTIEQVKEVFSNLFLSFENFEQVINTLAKNHERRIKNESA